jgi:endonuclease YncB( thermonuclease family)
MKKYLNKWYTWVLLVIVFIIIISSLGNPKNVEVKPEIQKQEAVNINDNSYTETKSEEVKQPANPVSTTTQKTETPVSTKTVQQPAKQDGYKVVSVVDGDTIKVSINGTTETLRIIGLDTPETLDPRKPVQCFGKEASNKAKELLSGKTVVLEADSTQGELDKYGRLLRYVFVDGTDYGKYMIANGYAHEYTYHIPYKYQTEYKNAQKSAEANQLGFWSPNSCNGNTTSSTTTSTTVTPTTTGKYYTSSYSTSKYYYPEACSGWKSLNAKYLKSFNTLDELLKTYPSRTLSSQC